jgi:hypothetical protein
MTEDLLKLLTFVPALPFLIAVIAEIADIRARIARRKKSSASPRNPVAAKPAAPERRPASVRYETITPSEPAYTASCAPDESGDEHFDIISKISMVAAGVTGFFYIISDEDSCDD